MDSTPTSGTAGARAGGWQGLPQLVRRGVVLGLGVGVFTLVASVVDPRPSPAADERPPGAARGPAKSEEVRRAEVQRELLERAHPKGWKVLGLMEGAEYYVLIHGAPEGPRYTVCTLTGRVLQADLPADDVYRAFPTVDVEGMRLEPAQLPQIPDGPALMLADPQD